MMNDINNGLSVGDYIYHQRLNKYGTIKKFEWCSNHRAAAVECDGDPNCVYIFNIFEINLASNPKPKAIKITKMEPDEDAI